MKAVLCRLCGLNETTNRTGECKRCRKPESHPDARPTIDQRAAFYVWAEPQGIELSPATFSKWLKEIDNDESRTGKDGAAMCVVLPDDQLLRTNSSKPRVLRRLLAPSDTATETSGESESPTGRCTDAEPRNVSSQTRSRIIGKTRRQVSKDVEQNLEAIVKRIESTESYPWINTPKNLQDLIRNTVMESWNWGMCRFQPFRDVVVTVSSCGYRLGETGIIMACRRERNGVVMCKINFGGSRYAWIPEMNLSDTTSKA